MTPFNPSSHWASWRQKLSEARRSSPWEAMKTRPSSLLKRVHPRNLTCISKNDRLDKLHFFSKNQWFWGIQIWNFGGVAQPEKIRSTQQNPPFQYHKLPPRKAHRPKPDPPNVREAPDPWRIQFWNTQGPFESMFDMSEVINMKSTRFSSIYINFKFCSIVMCQYIVILYFLKNSLSSSYRSAFLAAESQAGKSELLWKVWRATILSSDSWNMWKNHTYHTHRQTVATSNPAPPEFLNIPKP